MRRAVTVRLPPAGTQISELSRVPVRPVTLSDHRPPEVPGLRNVRTNWQLATQFRRAMLGRFSVCTWPPVPGLAARTMRRTAWGQDPYARGAYSTFKPGQLTRFAPHFWLEEEGAVTQQAVAGPIVFAGEHLSDAFPGYMNGAVQTGRIAAQSVLAERRRAAA